MLFLHWENARGWKRKQRKRVRLLCHRFVARRHSQNAPVWRVEKELHNERKKAFNYNLLGENKARHARQRRNVCVFCKHGDNSAWAKSDLVSHIQTHTILSKRMHSQRNGTESFFFPFCVDFDPLSVSIWKFCCCAVFMSPFLFAATHPCEVYEAIQKKHAFIFATVCYPLSFPSHSLSPSLTYSLSRCMYQYKAKMIRFEYLRFANERAKFSVFKRTQMDEMNLEFSHEQSSWCVCGSGRFQMSASHQPKRNVGLFPSSA